ncbi:hypothetical protein [Cognatitamlana onchidii]|uniref:hypothetical protein n=1 Tax=Cognatitamlana onchidii TaxID=2562860 RepID=UPI0010A68684|nr:hypothetical protein [Algibacter onchidii]
MKKLAVLLALMFVSITSFAQKRSDLRGPQYKNYKPWKHDTKSTPLYTSNTKEGLKGPEYKNYKPWKNKGEAKYQEVATTVNERAKLTGPKYKNYKPWRNKKAEESTVVARHNELDQE